VTLVHRYAIMPFQFRFIHETNQLKKSFTYKDKQNHLRRSSVVYKLTCTCGSSYIGQTRRNLITRIIEHKFDQRSEVCKHLLANPMHRFNVKQPEILGSIVCQKELHLLESLLIQQYQPDLNVDVDGSSIPCCFLTHNGLYDATQYECSKLHPYFSFDCPNSFNPMHRFNFKQPEILGSIQRCSQGGGAEGAQAPP